MNITNFHDLSVKIVWTYYAPILFILGTIGNILAISVLSHQQSRLLSAFLYLSARSIADEIVLITGLLRRIIENNFLGLLVEDYSPVTCKVTQFVGNCASYISVWLIVLLTLERCLIILRPFQNEKRYCVNSAKRNIIILCTTFSVVCCHYFYTVDHVFRSYSNLTNITRCEFIESLNTTFPQIDAVIYFHLPFVLISVMNAVIVLQVYKASKFKYHLSGNNNLENRSMKMTIRNKDAKSITVNGPSSETVSQRNFNPSPLPQMSIKNEATKQLTIMMLVVSITFLITTLPIIILSSLPDTFYNIDNDNNTNNTYLQYTESMMYINHSINFYLYCATGKKFRVQFCLMLTSFRRSLSSTRIFSKCFSIQSTEDHMDGTTMSTRFYCKIDNTRKKRGHSCSACITKEYTPSVSSLKGEPKLNTKFSRRWKYNKSSNEPKLKVSWKPSAEVPMTNGASYSGSLFKSSTSHAYPINIGISVPVNTNSTAKHYSIKADVDVY